MFKLTTFRLGRRGKRVWESSRWSSSFSFPPPLIPERSVISATLSRAPLSALYPHLKCKTLYGTIVSNFFGSHLTHPTQLAAHNTIDYDWRGLWSHVYYYRHKNGNGWRWKPVECRAGRPCYFEGEQHFSHKWKESGCYDYYFHMKYILDVEDYMGLRAEEILLVQGGKTTPPTEFLFVSVVVGCTSDGVDDLFVTRRWAECVLRREREKGRERAMVAHSFT